MTCEEFSNTFDTLLNSYNIQAGFGEGSNKQGAIALDEYEKSVLLTQAQDIVVKSYFDRSLNSQGQGFDDSTRRQVDFSSLIKVEEGKVHTAHIKVDDEGKVYTAIETKYDDRSTLYDLNKDILLMLNEKLIVTTTEGNTSNSKSYIVVPINYKEYDREMSKPYGQPLKKQAWRLFQNDSTGYDIISEIIPRYDSIPKGSTCKYIYRYVRRPAPIVLVDLPDGLSVDGKSNQKSCELNPILHMDILNKAYELAIRSRSGSAQLPSDDREAQRQ